MTYTEEQNAWVSKAIEKYLVVYWPHDDGIKRQLILDDWNISKLVEQWNQMHGIGAAFTLQGVMDVFRSPWGQKSLHWKAKETPQQQPAAPPIPQQPKARVDGRDRFNKLVDVGLHPFTHKSSPQDQVAEKERHDAARNRLKALFTKDPKRAEFDRELHNVNVFVEVINGRIDRAKTNRIKEQMRAELRQKYPQFSELLKQPDSERPDVKL